MEMKLSKGAVAAIWKDAAAVSALGVPLVLQLVEVERWLEAPEPGWHRMILSDGDHFIAGALPPDRPASRAVLSTREGALLRLLRFECRTTVDKRVIVPEVLEVLQTEWVKIGNPKQYQSTQLEGKHEELNVQSESSSSEPNTGAYFAGQGLKALLTRGILMMLQQPVLQVVSVVRSGKEILEEFHLVLSDGVHTRNATLASHLNYLVNYSHLQMGTIVRLLEFTCSTVQSHSLISVVQLEVIQTECELIGRPKAYEPCCIENPCVLQTRRSEPHHGLVPNYTQQEDASHSSDQGLKRLLTGAAIVAMLEGKMAVEQRPVMQVVDISLASKTKLFMYSVLLSDGVYQEHALLHSDMVPLVENFLLCNGSIVRILKSECDTSMNYRVFIVKLEVLLKKCGLIGSPTFHPLGLKHKEWYANPAASVPVLHEQIDPRVLALLKERAKSSFQSYPGYKSRPG